MFSQFLTQDIGVLRATDTKDGGGGIIKDYVLRETLKGRFRYLKAGEAKVSDQDRREVMGRVYLASGSDVLITDRLVVDGITYRVVAVDNPMSMSRHLEIDVELYSENN